jgi:hypothetical protein
VIALLLGFLASSGFAGNIISSNPTCVTNNSSGGWVLTGPNGGACGGTTAKPGDPLLPATFVVPEGAENAIDPVGDFTFNKAFAGANSYVTIMDVTGGISDYILAGNTFGGLGEVFFYSDPQTPPTLTGYINAGTWCNETATGCVSSVAVPFADGSFVTITAGSDGESGTFDPFNSGGNTSDGIQFTSVPEPSTWIMSGLLLVVAGLARRRTI